MVISFYPRTFPGIFLIIVITAFDFSVREWGFIDKSCLFDFLRCYF